MSSNSHGTAVMVLSSGFPLCFGLTKMQLLLFTAFVIAFFTATAELDFPGSEDYMFL
jgi:hypothetical protein